MISITAERSLDNGVTTIRLCGELTTASAPEIRLAIGKAAAECPSAVIADLSGLECHTPALMSVLPAAGHQAQENWGVPVLCCGAGEDLVRALGAYRSFVALYDYYWQAALAVRAEAPRWRRRHLKPVPSSAAAARGLVTGSCVEWGSDDLRDAARLVASELASNAIVHARTEFDITVACTARFLRIAVQDGSTALPQLISHSPASIVRAGAGRGLRVVTGMSTHWGVIPLDDGKIVWALLRTRPG